MRTKSKKRRLAFLLTLAGGYLFLRKRKRSPAGESWPLTPKEIARRLAEEPWAGNTDVIDELVAPDYVGHNPPNREPNVGPQGFREFVETYRSAFPDGRITVDAQLADGDRVVSRWTAQGTHRGKLMGIAPTGREVTTHGITISRISAGKVVESWSNWDALGMLVQLGVVPEPARA
jgi:predicted ester cyclase